MKAELRLADHSRVDGAKVIEIWHDGQFIGQVVGADGPGVRVITKHQLKTDLVDDGLMRVLEVAIDL